ncbi:MAG: hypothetical protein KY468_04515 [Armatimonadetes bacterium]|nr:hypothetical protein [Armatimonadota bacterium]
MGKVFKSSRDDPTQNTGFNRTSGISHYIILCKATEELLRQIANNAGLEGSVVVEKVRNLKKGQGLNAQTEEYGDLVKQGVVDPVKTTRSALQNAASIASMVLTTEALVAEKPEKKSNGGGAGDGMDDECYHPAPVPNRFRTGPNPECSHTFRNPQLTKKAGLLMNVRPFFLRLLVKRLR